MAYVASVLQVPTQTHLLSPHVLVVLQAPMHWTLAKTTALFALNACQVIILRVALWPVLHALLASLLTPLCKPPALAVTQALLPMPPHLQYAFPALQAHMPTHLACLSVFNVMLDLIALQLAQCSRVWHALPVFLQVM